MNDVWSIDKPSMKIKTLEANLNVKINSDLDCLKYYESIKDNKKLQVQSEGKYKSNAGQPQPSTSSSVPSLIQVSDSDDSDN